ncbi:MAG: hypothetical protein LBC99_11430 [Spirochaetota bacterium]|jgi:hypothetical protein|nr:hypothetical protein [Spirochaetota bacterium]
MTLIEVRHFEELCDIFNVVNMENDWTEGQCREYIEVENKKRHKLVHNESKHRDYYITGKEIPEWQDDAWYDYSKCTSRGKPESTCDTGCAFCPYEESCYILQMRQQLEWIERECEHLQ